MQFVALRQEDSRQNYKGKQTEFYKMKKNRIVIWKRGRRKFFRVKEWPQSRINVSDSQNYHSQFLFSLRKYWKCLLEYFTDNYAFKHGQRLVKFRMEIVYHILIKKWIIWVNFEWSYIFRPRKRQIISTTYIVLVAWYPATLIRNHLVKIGHSNI